MPRRSSADYKLSEGKERTGNTTTCHLKLSPDLGTSVWNFSETFDFEEEGKKNPSLQMLFKVNLWMLVSDTEVPVSPYHIPILCKTTCNMGEKNSHNSRNHARRGLESISVVLSPVNKNTEKSVSCSLNILQHYFHYRATLKRWIAAASGKGRDSQIIYFLFHSTKQ